MKLYLYRQVLIKIVVPSVCCKRLKLQSGTMNSVGEECIELKQSYDTCFNKWFAEKFLRGLAEEDKDCSNIFTAYQLCVKKALKSQNISIAEVERDVLGTEEENQPPPNS
ncbi:hypothetical protein Pmani_018812 [Petrolisthes manimaculis]|uniref:TP53-regulated inhibitor of apoptosis 1 n=1 Tax=Petrolisthes manimaculis TaxID=1843537 RepID=A0AAE1PJE4_9EUCA|nr:hypothetical protein Pmani_018812 [Petrolisthes manimaculis]